MALTERDLSEIHGMSNEELNATVAIMQRQVAALFFIGDRKRSQAIHDTAQAEIERRLK